MFTIHLNKLSFFAHHGLHNEEAITGTRFEVDAAVTFVVAGKINSIQQTINYVALYDVIKKHMLHPLPLLETVAQNIAEDIHQVDNRIKTINISINKLHPPIENFMGSVGVSYFKEY